MNTITLTTDALAQIIADAIAKAQTVAVQPEAGTEAASQAPTAPADTYRVRTDRQKDASHKRIAAVNTRWDMKLVGGSRKVSDLTPTERVQYDAEVKACWTKPAGKTVAKA